MVLVGLAVTPPPSTPPSATLVVDQAWDGRRLEAPAATVSLNPTAEVLRIEVEAVYHGDPPPPGPPRSIDRLWQFEVVEVFVAGSVGEDGQVSYTEVELGPHGHHLVLRLEGARNVIETGLPMVFAAEIDGDRWRGVAEVPWSFLPVAPFTGNAYAIHGLGKQRRYRAAFSVPGAAPDFHQPSRFRPLGIKCPVDRNALR